MEELENYINSLEDLLREACEKDPLGDSSLSQYYLAMLRQARTNYLSLLTMTREKEVLGYVKSEVKALNVDVNDEIKWIEANLSFKPKDVFGKVVALAEFCRKCEESILCNEIMASPLYINKLNWCKEGLKDSLSIQGKPTNETGEVFERLYRGNGYNITNKNWIYLNILLPMYDKWSEVNQAEMLSNYTLKQITQKLG